MPDPSPPLPTTPRWLLPTIVAAGTICRLAQYFSRRSYWEDESFIVLQLKYRTAGQLLGPLADFTPPQAAPPLWLLAQRGLLLAFGTHEFAMRLIALVAGIAALVLFAIIAKRLHSPIAAATAVALFAFSNTLIWHGTEVKPYSSDTFFATWVLLVVLRREQAPLVRLMIAAVIAAVGVWFSYPLIFVFGGASLALLPAILSNARHRSQDIAIWLLCNAAAVASFLAVLLTVIRRQQLHDLDDYWADDMADYAHPLKIPLWLGNRLMSLTDALAGHTWPAIAVLSIFAIAWLWRRDRERLAILTLPILLTILAAFAKRYPLDGGRVNLFLAPGLTLLAGYGIDGILTLRPAVKRGWVAAAAVLINAPQIVFCVIALFVPRTRASARPAVEYVLAHREPGQAVYTISVHQVWCYWPDSEPHPQNIKDVTPAPGRFWLITTNRPGRRAEKVEDRLKPARNAGTQIGKPYIVSDGGGAVYLFETK